MFLSQSIILFSEIEREEGKREGEKLFWGIICHFFSQTSEVIFMESENIFNCLRVIFCVLKIENSK